MCWLPHLPRDVLRGVLDHLEIRDLDTISKVCRALKELTESEDQRFFRVALFRKYYADCQFRAGTWPAPASDGPDATPPEAWPIAPGGRSFSGGPSNPFFIQEPCSPERAGLPREAAFSAGAIDIPAGNRIRTKRKDFLPCNPRSLAQGGLDVSGLGWKALALNFVNKYDPAEIIKGYEGKTLTRDNIPDVVSVLHSCLERKKHGWNGEGLVSIEHYQADHFAPPMISKSILPIPNLDLAPGFLLIEREMNGNRDEPEYEVKWSLQLTPEGQALAAASGLQLSFTVAGESDSDEMIWSQLFRLKYLCFGSSERFDTDWHGNFWFY
ncbi:hypothetical protein DFJ73DRAFT_830612 [Zopfochytrium polystomum]|nr:hypothetical protein DFJ73DRAFT_830612 [Zopfochytrium polystomum]